MTRAKGTLVWVKAAPSAPAHFKARVRFSSGLRPWVHLPPTMREPDARVHVAALTRCATEHGFVIEQRDTWIIRVLLVDGSLTDIEDGITDEAEAFARGRAIAARVREKGHTAASVAQLTPRTETCTKWWKRHLAFREDKGQSSVKDARGRFTNWIEPTIGTRRMADVSSPELEALVAKLDAAVADDVISWKTAKNVWGEVTAAFSQACTSKLATLRVRSDNPTRNVRGPDRGAEREKPILFPDEVITLLSCAEVPLYRRRAYAVAIYLGGRANELAALTASDVDVVHARISIAKQVDRNTGDTRQTKTKRARSFDIEPELLPLLKLLIDERGDGRLVHLPPDEQRADLLRKDLRTAGVMREALHVENDPLRAWIRFHNLRDTCLTWMAVRGDDPMRIQWRGGHSDFRMTQAYIAAGRNVGAGFGVPFPPLPKSLLVKSALDGRRAQCGRVISDQTRTTPPIAIAPSLLFSTRNERPQRDSNPNFRGMRADRAGTLAVGVQPSMRHPHGSVRNHARSPVSPQQDGADPALSRSTGWRSGCSPRTTEADAGQTDPSRSRGRARFSLLVSGHRSGVGR
jgi:integrase